MKKVVLAMAALLTISLSACSQSNKKKLESWVERSLCYAFSRDANFYLF